MLTHAIALSLVLAATPPADREPPTIEVTVDARVELLAAVQLLAGDGRLTRFDHGYRREMLETFDAHRGHRAVTLYREMRRHGFGYDAPVRFVLCLSEPPALVARAAVDEDLVRRAGSREALDAFAAALRDFADVSHFDAFHSAHKPLHRRMIERAAPLLDGLDPGLLEGYYGEARDQYAIVLAPLFHPGGYGVSVTDAEGSTSIYGVLGPHGVDEDEPRFGSRDMMRYLVWHEFSHSFVNPIVDANAEQLDALDALFPPVRTLMTRQSYGTWRITLYEHFVRAVTCRFAALELGPGAGTKMLAVERDGGFLYVGALAARLEAYEADRATYPTLASFVPDLASTLESIITEHPERLRIPRITEVTPAPATKDLAPGPQEIRVVFDIDMDTTSWSWMRGDAGVFPELAGDVRWPDPRTCVLPVRLAPGTRYWLGINTGGGRMGFRSAFGVPVEPFEIELTSRGDP